MITLTLTEEEASALLSIATKLRPLVPCDRAKRRAQVNAFIDAHPDLCALEVARRMKKARIYSDMTYVEDIKGTVETRREKLARKGVCP